MASSIIHMCIAKKVNESLKIPDFNMLLLGSIAPDISKHVGQTKMYSHFYDEEENVDINKFLNKYMTKLRDPFMMGYFIHLYSDYLWEKYFVSEIVNKNSITLLNGDKVDNSIETYKKLIYNDYTNLNIDLLDVYDLDLSLFYNETRLPNIEMDEIPISKLSLLIDNASVIIENSSKNKAYTFDIKNVINFIELSTQLIISLINEKRI